MSSFQGVCNTGVSTVYRGILITRSYSTVFYFCNDNNFYIALIDNETLNEQFRQFNSDLGPNDRFGLHHFTYNNSAMLDMIFNSIRDIDFIGLTVSHKVIS